MLAPFALALFARRAIEANPAPSALPTLTAARQIHGLSNEEAARGYPVRLDGAIVLYYNADLGNLFLFDPTGGVYVEMRGQKSLPLRPGDRLRVEGVSAPGGYAPLVDRPQITILSHGPMPPAPRVSLDFLLSGAADTLWVEVEGIVRKVVESDHLTAYADQAASGQGNVLMDGFEATIAIREGEHRNGGHQRIVAMTAYAMKDDAGKCLVAGMDGYLSKPIQVRQLCELLEDTAAQAPVEALRPI